MIAVIEALRSTILARLLSPVDFGLMGMVMIVIGFADAYTDLGISAAIIHRQDTTREQLSSLYWLNIFTGLVAFGLVWVCMSLIAALFREPRVVPLLQPVAIALVISSIGKQFEILLQKELQFNVLARQEIIASFGSLIVAIVCAVSGLGVWALVWASLTNATLKTVFLVRIGLYRFRPLFHFSRSDLKAYVGFGLFQMGERTINYLGERLDQILIGTLLGARTLGFYNFAFNLAARPISRINPIVTKVAFPVFSKVQDDPERLRRGYLKVLGFLTTINAPLLIGLAAVAPKAVPLIFGAKWTQSIILIQILSLVALSRSIGNPIGSLQLAKGRADLGFKWNVFFLLVSIPAIWGGYRVGGATGIAGALLLLQMFLQVLAYFYLVRRLLGECARGYTAVIMKPIALSSAMGLIVAPLPLLLTGLSVILVFTLQIAIGISVFLVLLWLFHSKVLSEFRNLFFARAQQPSDRLSFSAID